MIAPNKHTPDLEDTIVALATPDAPAPRGVVRLSGKHAWAIAQKLIPDHAGTARPPRGVYPARFRLSAFHASITGQFLLFPGSASYTGQDLLELHVPSSPPILEQILADCLGHGARSAQPGEFTLRSFLSGKLDLTQAEAVLGIIEARGDDELRDALRQLAGGLTHPLQELRNDLLNLLADVEAGLDFADEDLQFIPEDELLKRLARGLALVTNLKRQVDQRSLGQKPMRVVLAGPVNAGKSSLFNALVGQRSALVSPRAGTTRDYLVKRVTLSGLAFDFVDTAGLRESDDSLESASQRLGEDEISRADLVLWCRPMDNLDAPASPPGIAGKTLEVFTKTDFAPAPVGSLGVSPIWDEGIDDLRRALVERAEASTRAPLAFSLGRCRHHVDACLTHLRQAHHLVLQQTLPELLALEIRLAIDELGEMLGAVHTDDLLDRIFSRFCIGK